MNTTLHSWLECLAPWLPRLVTLSIVLTVYSDYQRWQTYREFGYLPEWWHLVLAHTMLALVIAIWFVSRLHRNRIRNRRPD